MNHYQERLLATAVAVLLPLAGASWAFSEEPQAERFAADIVALSRLVLEQHVEPPTQQQIVLAAARGLYEASETEGAPHDLATQCSNAAGDAALRAIVTKACGAGFGSDVELDAKQRAAAVRHMSRVIPGGVTVESLKAHAANTQLAENRYVGVGIAVRMDDSKEFIITSLIPGGPMQRAGVPEQTIIREIEGWKTRGQRIEECVERLRGPEGSSVQLVIHRPDQNGDEPLTLHRGVVPRRTLRADLREARGKRLAYIAPEQLSASLPHEVRDFIAGQGKLDGVILDLRETSPGPAHFAVMLADLFLQEGDIGFLCKGKSRRRIAAEEEELFPTLPVAVIVGPSTAGSCEWLATALVENGRAVAFGRPTLGFAVENESFTLPSGQLVASFAAVVLETRHRERLLARLEAQEPTSEVKANGPQGEPPTRVSGQLIPAIVNSPPAIGESFMGWLNQSSAPQRTSGPMAIVPSGPPMDELNAAIRYLVQAASRKTEKGAE